MSATSRHKCFCTFVLMLALAGPCAPLGPAAEKASAEITALHIRVVDLYKEGKYAEAMPLAKRALDMTRTAFGEDDPRYARGLVYLALLHKHSGEYVEAERLYLRAVSVEEKVLGENDPEYAGTLNNLAVLYDSMGLYAKAEPLYVRAMEIRKRVLGEEHSDYAQSVSNLLNLNMDAGQYDKVEQLLTRATKITKEAFGEDVLSYAEWLGVLSAAHAQLGRYDVAESLLAQVTDITSRPAGDYDLAYAGCLNNLGAVYSLMGKYDKAKLLLVQAMEIAKKKGGVDHLEYADSLNNLAALYIEMGRYDETERLLTEALGIRSRLGEKHPKYLDTVTNLGLLYLRLARYDDSERLLVTVMEMRRSALGEDHPDYAGSINNLAALYYSMGQYGKAEPLYVRATETRKKAVGEDHPDYARSLSNLAALYHLTGQYEKAEPLYLRAMEIRKKALGGEHPHYAASLYNLGLMCGSVGRWSDALDNLCRGMAVEQQNLRRVFPSLSDRERSSYLETVSGSLYVLLSVAAAVATDEGVGLAGLDWTLRRKGILMSALLEERQVLRLAGDPETSELWEKLRSARSQLAGAVYAGPGRAGFEAYRSRCAHLNAQIEELQESLALKSRAFRAEQVTAEADTVAVSAVLPPGSALVEIVAYSVCDFKALAGTGGGEAYVCFVLKAGDKTPVMIDLGKAEPVDAAVSGFRRAIRQANQAIADKGEAQAEKELAQAGQALYQQVWSKIEPHLKDVTRVYLSPDGDLNLVSFGALRDGEGKYLAERYVFDYLASGRDLLRPRAGESGKKGLVAFADPDFGGSAAQGTLMVSRDVFRSAVTDRGILGELRFPPLPGTRDECKAIADLAGKRGLSVESHVGAEATEAALKNISAPRILHLATHGFFLPDTEWKKESPQDRFEIARFGESKPRASALLLHNPMHRSGLALAGAARAIKDEQLAAGQEDGLVTAEEVVTLDLEGTKLVTLSACETGVGEVKRGEGVMGLRRAFIMAGTEGLLMTLWNVPDVGTRDLMVKFYERYFQTGDGPLALVEAQRVIIAERRAKSGAAHPFYWGAFVITGAEK